MESNRNTGSEVLWQPLARRCAAPPGGTIVVQDRRLTKPARSEPS